MKALIVGAGIGGLVTALQMHRAGIEIEVFDSVSSLKALGVGINLQPHAVRILADLGLLEDLRKISVLPTQMDYRTPDGKLIISDPRGLKAGYRYPQLAIHRGQLQMCLLKAFVERVGSEKLHLAHQFSMFKQNEKEVSAHFINPKTREPFPLYRGDVLVGADGIKSVVRAQIHPHEKPLHFEGIMMWRGASYQKPPFDGAVVSVCGNSTVELILYPISAPNSEGKVLLNWVVEILNPEANSLPKEIWNRPGQLKDFIHHFKNWNLNFVDLKSLFEDSENILEYPMVDRDPLPFWSENRVTLLGDAAHPMYPRGGNGASQAILDSKVLVDCLEREVFIPAALKKYEAERLPATARVVQNNRHQNQTEIFNQIDRCCQGKCKEKHTCVAENILRNIIETYKADSGGSVSQVNNGL